MKIRRPRPVEVDELNNHRAMRRDDTVSSQRPCADHGSIHSYFSCAESVAYVPWLVSARPPIDGFTKDDRPMLSRIDEKVVPHATNGQERFRGRTANPPGGAA